MTRIAMKTFAAVLFAATLGSAPVAAQKNPWEPGYLPTVMPSAKPESLPRDSATKISPFASKFAKDWPHLAPSQPSEWDRLGLGLKDGRVMDTKAFPNNRALVKSWVADFPNLGYDFEVLEAATRAAALCRSVAGKDSVPPGTYNCIAYTTGIKNVWLDPYQTVAGWDLYYGREFTRSKTLDVSLEVGLLKVAV